MGFERSGMALSGLGNKDIMSKNLKYYIERSGKDRRELSEIWGFPYSSVSEWVNGRKYPRIDKIEIMADYFGIKKSDLIEEKPTTQDDGLSDLQREIMTMVQSAPEDIQKEFRNYLLFSISQRDK